MAEATSKLNILVQVRDEASATLSRLSSDVSELGGSLNFASGKAGILAGALAAIAGATLLKSITAFEEGQVALAQMDAILKTIPDGISKYREQILRAADAAIRFGFDNELAALQITKLFKATGDINFSLEAFQAAMDLARFKGISLEDATQALILAFQGGGRLLKQFGIEIDEHASKQTILQAVLNTTKGQAEAFTETSRGMRAVLLQLGSEILEIIGEPFVKTFTIIGQAALNNFDSIIRFINEKLKPALQLLPPLLMAAIGFGTGIAVAAAIKAVLAFIGIAAPAFLSLFGPAGLIIGALVGFAVLFIANWDKIRSFVVPIIDSIRSAVEWLLGVMDRVASAASRAVSAVSGFASSAFGTVRGFLGLQEGGIVTRPTVAMIGEAGAEAVIPLNRLGGAGLGGGITINLSGDFYTDMETAERWANQIAKVIKFQLKL